MSSSRVTERGEAKRNAVVEAATRAFLTQGYEASSMDAIAADAGVSKRTVYNHFPEGKRDLFGAVVGRLYTGLHSAGQERLPFDQPPERALPEFLRALLVHMRRPELRGLLRLVIAEHRRFPELAQDYQRMGKSPAIGLLERYIAAQGERGRLHVSDPHMAAARLLGAIKEVLFWPSMLGLPVTDDDEAVIADAVAALLRADGQSGEAADVTRSAADPSVPPAPTD